MIGSNSKQSDHCLEELQRYLCLIGAPPCSRDCSLKKIPCEFCLSVHRACSVDIFQTFLTDDKVKEYWGVVETLLKRRVTGKFDIDTLIAIRNFMQDAYNSCDKHRCFRNKTHRRKHKQKSQRMTPQTRRPESITLVLKMKGLRYNSYLCLIPGNGHS